MRKFLAAGLFLISLTGHAASQSSTTRDSAIVAAVRFARGLQKTYWDSLYIPRHRVPQRAVILAHYRRGYGDSLAAAYTAYALEHAPEPVMVAPDTVWVLHATATEAYAAYATPRTLREIWDFPAYTTDFLQYARNHWFVIRSTRSAAKPVSF